MQPSIASGPAQVPLVRLLQDGRTHTTHELVEAISRRGRKKTAYGIFRHTIQDLRRKGYKIRSIKRGRWIMEAMPVITIKQLAPPEAISVKLDDLNIVNQVAIEARLKLDDLLGKTRIKPYVRARWLAYERLRAKKYSLQRIGRTMRKDHTTIMHGLREIKTLREIGLTDRQILLIESV